jgi:hypothetical protein
MKSRIMYIEHKADLSGGEARIGRVSFSKRGKTLRYGGKSFQSLRGRGFKANYFEVGSGQEHWISGCKRDGSDRLYGERVPVRRRARRYRVNPRFRKGCPYLVAHASDAGERDSQNEAAIVGLTGQIAWPLAKAAGSARSRHRPAPSTALIASEKTPGSGSPQCYQLRPPSTLWRRGVTVTAGKERALPPE